MNEPILPVPSTVAEPLPVQPPVTSSRHLLRSLLFVVGGLVVLAGVVACGWYIYQQHGPSSAFLPKGSQVKVSLGLVPVGQMFSLKQNELAIEASPIAEAQVIDMVADGATKYYLIGDTATRTSNIYRSEEGKLSKITNSNTLKFDLAFDPSSKTFAYISGEVASTTLESFATSAWKLAVFSETGGERLLPVSGHRPVFLPGGTQLLIANDGKIELVQVSTGARKELLTIDAAAPFAVTADGTSLALFNRTTAAVDYFSLSGTALSYQYSKKVTGIPLALSFADTQTLIMVASTEERKSIQFSVVGGASLAVPNPIVGLLPQKITISYE